MFKLSKLWPSARLCAGAARNSSASNISRKARLCLSAVFAFGALCASPHGASAAPGPLVATQEGIVQGVISNGVAEFLGVPYAEPPLGNLRWKPPKNKAAWSGVLKTQAYAPICAQITTLGVFAGPANNNEDCLYLNVFTPNLDPSAKLPVIVWIHGGGNVDGETPGYDGSKMAVGWQDRRRHHGIPPEPHGLARASGVGHEGHLFGNYGMLDQQAVLKWVKRNIAKFGGDKSNVTLGGQSAGAIDTGLNMVSPLAAGMFQRGICESYLPALPGCRTKGVRRGERRRLLGRGRLRLRHGFVHRQMPAQPHRRAGRGAGGHGERAERIHPPAGHRGRPDHTRTSRHGVHERPVQLICR